MFKGNGIRVSLKGTCSFKIPFSNKEYLIRLTDYKGKVVVNRKISGNENIEIGTNNLSNGK